MTLRRLIGITLSLGLTVLLLWLFLRGSDWHGVWKGLRSASPGYLALTFPVGVVSLLLRTLRWQFLLRPVRPSVRFYPLFKATLASFAVTGVLPGRVGELARPYLASRWEKIPLPPVLASAVLDRVLDLVALFVLWWFFLLWGAGEVAQEGRAAMEVFTTISLIGTLAFIPMGVFLWWLAPRRERLQRFTESHAKVRRIPGFDRFLQFFLRFAEGLGAFQRKRDVGLLLLLSVLAWGAVAVAIAFLLRSVSLPIPRGGSLLLMMFISFGSAIPTPGGIGGVHKGIQVALTLFYGVSLDTAVAAGILGHAVLFIPGILWGLGYLVFGGVRVWDLEREFREGSSLPLVREGSPSVD